MGEKECDIQGCKNTFPQKSKNRVRLTKKKDKGEKVAWICPEHGSDLEEKINFRSDGNGA